MVSYARIKRQRPHAAPAPCSRPCLSAEAPAEPRGRGLAGHDLRPMRLQRELQYGRERGMKAEEEDDREQYELQLVPGFIHSQIPEGRISSLDGHVVLFFVPVSSDGSSLTRAKPRDIVALCLPADANSAYFQ